MSGKRKAILSIAGLALFLAGSVFLYQRLQDHAAPPLPTPPPPPVVETEQGAVEPTDDDRTKAPDFTALDADGAEVRLSDFEGKPVVLNFWASWCPPCKSEMPDFDRVCAELGDEVQFMMVDLVDGSRETADIGAAFIAEQGYTFPVFYDTSGEAAYLYGVRSIPTTLFIDRDGYIVTGAQGAIDETTLRRGIDMIVGG